MAEIIAALTAGLFEVVSWPTPLFVVAGSLLGFVVGVLPGLGGPALMALLLPALLPFTPTDALVLLTSAAAVTAMAGDLTSILLGVPGEATAAAVVADGHALARRGEGGRAVGAAVAASVMGALVGVGVLVAFVPVAQPVLSRIQSPELAALAVLGICLLVPLSRTTPVPGFTAGALGLALSTVGLDPSLGEPRFTFGQIMLWDGIGLLPMALGIYAVPEVLGAVRGRINPVSGGHGYRGVLAGCRDALAHTALVGRCSAIGAAIGILPGVGAAVAQWIAYGHASATARPSGPAMGEGAIEGVIGPAAATTATLGGAMVPTLSLGIPGSIVTAFLLSAMVLKGIVPGPALLLPARDGGQLSLVFALVWCVVLATFLGALVSVALLGSVARVASVRPARLFPVVLTLILIGTIGERHAPADYGMLLAIGVAGFALAEAGWPRAPLILGFVLGPLLERRLLLSNNLYGWQWVLRPGVLLLAAGVVVFLVAAARRRPPSERQRRLEAEPGQVVLAAAILLIAAVGLWQCRGLNARPALFPMLTLSVVLVLSATHLVRVLRARRRRSDMTPAAVVPASRGARLGWLAAYVAGAWLVGLVAGSSLATLVYLRREARESWLVAIAGSAMLAVIVRLLVVELMHVSDVGGLGTWLGS